MARLVQSVSMMEIPGYEPLLSVTPLAAICRLLAAFILGGAVGFNRELLGKPAGIRTHIMVTLGACTFLLMGVELLAGYAAAYNTQPDPTRVLQGVVGGIGFLGAGSIIHSKGNVEGVTTAATVWVAGAIGAGCGLGHYLLAVILVAFCLTTLWVLGKVDFGVSPPDSKKTHQKDSE